MRQRPRRVFEGGSLLADFLGGTIVSDINRLSRQTESVEQEMLSTTAARSGFVRPFQQLVFDGWGLQDVVAALSNVALGRFGTGWQMGLRPAVGGSVVALGVQMSEQRTGGNCTVRVFVDGSSTGLEAVIDGDARQTEMETRPAGEVLFAAGEEITLRVSTSGSWGPVTADLTAWIIVNMDDAG